MAFRAQEHRRHSEWSAQQEAGEKQETKEAIEKSRQDRDDELQEMKHQRKLRRNSLMFRAEEMKRFSAIAEEERQQEKQEEGARILSTQQYMEARKNHRSAEQQQRRRSLEFHLEDQRKSADAKSWRQAEQAAEVRNRIEDTKEFYDACKDFQKQDDLSEALELEARKADLEATVELKLEKRTEHKQEELSAIEDRAEYYRARELHR